MGIFCVDDGTATKEKHRADWLGRTRYKFYSQDAEINKRKSKVWVSGFLPKPFGGWGAPKAKRECKPGEAFKNPKRTKERYGEKVWQLMDRGEFQCLGKLPCTIAPMEHSG